jgi:hypothetical protein
LARRLAQEVVYQDYTAIRACEAFEGIHKESNQKRILTVLPPSFPWSMTVSVPSPMTTSNHDPLLCLSRVFTIESHKPFALPPNLLNTQIYRTGLHSTMNGDKNQASRVCNSYHILPRAQTLETIISLMLFLAVKSLDQLTLTYIHSSNAHVQTCWPNVLFKQRCRLHNLPGRAGSTISYEASGGYTFHKRI